MNLIKKVDKHLEEYLLIILFTLMVTVLFSQIVSRAVFNSSISWSEELTRYSFIYLVFIGISYAVKKRRHLNLTIVLNMLNKKMQKVLTLLSNVLFLFFAGFILYYGTNMVIQNLQLGQQTPALGIPMGLVYAGAPFGMALTVIRLFQNIYLDLKEKKS